MNVYLTLEKTTVARRRRDDRVVTETVIAPHTLLIDHHCISYLYFMEYVRKWQYVSERILTLEIKIEV